MIVICEHLKNSVIFSALFFASIAELRVQMPHFMNTQNQTELKKDRGLMLAYDSAHAGMPVDLLSASGCWRAAAAARAATSACSTGLAQLCQEYVR
mgnify:FL=1